MEPRVFTRGNVQVYGCDSRKGPASMEPRVFTRGNLLSEPEDVRQCVASMEPRVFTRGNRAGLARYVHGLQGFNGATRLHAWKPVVLWFDLPHVLPASM